jgi:hypothetical protein
MSIFSIIYVLAFPLKFFIFYHELGPISQLTKTIETKLKKKQSKKAEKHERRFQMLATIVFICSCSAEFLYIFDMIPETNQNFFKLSVQILTGFSSFFCEFSTFMHQFVFFNFSIYICALLEQIEDDLEDMQMVKDEKTIKERLGRVAEFHNEIQKIIVEFMRCFDNFLKVNFIIEIWLMAQAAIFSMEGKWLELLMCVPFLLFEAWLYCYAAQRIITKVCLKG